LNTAGSLFVFSGQILVLDTKEAKLSEVLLAPAANVADEAADAAVDDGIDGDVAAFLSAVSGLVL
jgi:hypothetical protein